MARVALQARIRVTSIATIGAAARAKGELAIRIKPIRPGELPGVSRSMTWGWAIVLEAENDHDRDLLLAGGPAESETAALAIASEELKKQRAKLARARAEMMTRKAR